MYIRSVYMQLCCSLQTEVQYANQLKQLQEIYFGYDAHGYSCPEKSVTVFDSEFCLV